MTRGGPVAARLALVTVLLSQRICGSVVLGGNLGGDVAQMLRSANLLMQAGRVEEALGIHRAVLTREPWASPSLKALGYHGLMNSDSNFGPEEQMEATLMLGRSFDALARPSPVDIDSQQGYEFAARIGYSHIMLFNYDAGREWLGKAIESNYPHDDCWELHRALRVPPFPESQEHMERVIARVHRELDRMLAMPSRLSVKLSTCFANVFWYAYYDTDHRALYAKYSALLLKTFPQLDWSAPHIDRVVVGGWYCDAPERAHSYRCSSSRNICEGECQGKFRKEIHGEIAGAEAHPSRTQGKLRVGFFSTFFTAQSSVFGSFGATIINLPRDMFEVVLIYYPNDSTSPQDRALSPTPENDVYLAAHGPALQNLERNRRAIAEKRLDVLVYLDAMMTAEVHHLLLARLAPVQCLTHGHPVTSGAPREIVDYFISWAAAELPDAQDRYTEELLLLPAHSPWEYYVPRTDPERQVSFVGGASFGHYIRESMVQEFLGQYDPAGLLSAAGRRWYWCAQAPFKFHPGFDSMLANIQAKDPNAVLIIIRSGGNMHFMHREFKARLGQRGVDVARMVFVPRLSHPRLMAMYRHADVVLDSWQFGGDTTTREAFEVGAPVVTLPHKSLGSRWTQAYYRIIGVTELIATDKDHYVRLAVRTANMGRAEKASLRQRIKTGAFERLFKRKEAIGMWADALVAVSGYDPRKQAVRKVEAQGLGSSASPLGGLKRQHRGHGGIESRVREVGAGAERMLSAELDDVGMVEAGEWGEWDGEREDGDREDLHSPRDSRGRVSVGRMNSDGRRHHHHRSISHQYDEL